MATKKLKTTYYILELKHEHTLTDEQLESFKTSMDLACPISYDNYQYDYRVYKGEFKGPHDHLKLRRPFADNNWVEIIKKEEGSL